jgi:hypothetical protein
VGKNIVCLLTSPIPPVAPCYTKLFIFHRTRAISLLGLVSLLSPASIASPHLSGPGRHFRRPWSAAVRFYGVAVSALNSALLVRV